MRISSATNTTPQAPPRRLLALYLPRLPTDRIRRERACAKQGDVRHEARNALPPAHVPEKWTPVFRKGHAPIKESRGHPDSIQSGCPLVVVAKLVNALRLTALDDRAAAEGLSPGMALTDARAIAPALDVVAHDEDADRRLLAAIADWCERFTPFVALDPPDGLILDITGCAHLVGGEAALRETIVTRLAAQGLAARAAIAGTQRAARALCRFSEGAIVPRGREAEAVAALPVAALDTDPDIIRALQRAGLYRLGDVAARPRAPLVSRFGAPLAEALDQLAGRSDAPLSPRRPLPHFATARLFADPIADHETVFATLEQLAADLAAALEHHGKGGRLFEASFFRADGAVRRIAAEAGLPLRDPVTMVRLFRERLDALADPLDPGFGFDLIRLAALEVATLEASATTFDSAARDDHAVAALIDRLGARFGPRRVVRFLAQDTHIPEASAVAAPAARNAPTQFGWVSLRHEGEPPVRPLRLFTPPEPVEALAEVPDGPPARFRWRRAWHDVVKAEGPERIAMEWWRIGGTVLTRDYFRVEDGEGRRFWIFRDGLFGRETAAPRWFMHGLFA
jgi:protein ImuB